MRWNDPALGIDWPIEPAVISARGRSLSAARCILARLTEVKRVLVTGAGGFIGRCEPRAARRAGYEVHGVLSLRGPGPALNVRGARRSSASRRPARCRRDRCARRAGPADAFAAFRLDRDARAVSQPARENHRWLAASRICCEAFARAAASAPSWRAAARNTIGRACGIATSARARSRTSSGTALTPYADARLPCSARSRRRAHTGPVDRVGPDLLQFGPHEHPAAAGGLGDHQLLVEAAKRPARTDVKSAASCMWRMSGAAFAALFDSELKGP